MSIASSPASFPVLTTKLKFSALGRPRWKKEKPMPPLWETTAIPRARLASGRSPFSTCTTAGLNVAASGMRPFRKPSALGPRTAMSNSRAMPAIARWRAAPASPRSSPNPELMTIAAFTPTVPHARRVAPTCSAGMVTIARSTGPGSDSTEGWQGMPAISSWLRLTA